MKNLLIKLGLIVVLTGCAATSIKPNAVNVVASPNPAPNNCKLFRASNDFISIYHKRWSVEEYHKSFKQNVCMEKSPTRTVKTQKTHVFASLVAYIKLERYKFSTGLNHFAQKGKLFLNATKLAFQDLQKLKAENEAYEKSLASA